MTKPCRYFYQIDQDVYYIDDFTNQLNKEVVYKKDILNYSYFEAGKDYETNLESLLKYRTDFNKCNNECYSLNYKKYYNHESAVMMTFQKKSSNILKTLNLEPITFKEFIFMESTSNGGLINLDPDFANKTIQCFGYDFSAFYPNLLSNTDLQVPIKEGKRYKIKSLKWDKLRFGIYRVKITSDSKRFKKIFSFSKNNYYTHYSLLFAYRNQTKFSVSIELIIDGEYNALLWDEDKLVNTSTIFRDWFDYLNNLKSKFPKNMLVKRLMSSLWGTLISYKREFVEDENLFELDVSELDDPDHTEYKLLSERRYMDSNKDIRTVYQIIKSSEPYKNNLARLKPFIVSYGRTMIGDLIISEDIIDDVVRIHTDGICLYKKYDFTHLQYYPKPEDKTTGHIIWNNVNDYKKV